ncbi:PTS sugar transporter subunit IIB, partial [Enterococcus faecalis]
KTIDDSIKALNSGVTDKYKLFILCESVADMYQLVKEVPTIKEVNLGGMKNGETRKQISKAVHLSETDIAQIKELTNEGIELTVQLVPDDQKVAINKLLN